jgi:hypothetical protein
MFDLIDTSWGYGREGIQNDAMTLVSQKTDINFELRQTLVN